MCSRGGVVDDSAKAGGPPFAFVAVAAGGVVDGHLDVGGDDRRGDRVFAAIALVLHRQPSLTGQDQVTDDLAEGIEVVGDHDAGDQEVPALLGLIDEDMAAHRQPATV